MFKHTCDLMESSWLSVRISSNCCLSSTKASCFSQMSFSSIVMDSSISCFIPICTSNSFSTSYTNTLCFFQDSGSSDIFRGPISEMNLKIKRMIYTLMVYSPVWAEFPLWAVCEFLQALDRLRYHLPLMPSKRNTGQISEQRTTMSLWLTFEWVPIIVVLLNDC